MTTLFRSFFTVSSLTLVSRILGFARDIMIASRVGTGPLMDAFLVAFKLPNFFRRLFAEGAFNAAFVPMFSGKLAKEGEEDALRFAETMFSVLLWFLLAFTLIAEIIMPWALLLLAPGFADDPAQFELSVLLTRITFPYLLFISLVSLLSGVLNGYHKFAAMASAPILLNLSMLLALLYLSPYLPTEVHALAIGVSVAGVLQFIWLYAACRYSGIRIGLRMPRITKEFRQFMRKFIPGVIGAGVVQINVMLDVVIGTFIPGAIGYLYYADRINQLPLALIGTAMGMAMLPMLSRQIREEKTVEAAATQNRSVEIALFLSLPCAAGLMTLAAPIIQVLFERGEFTAGATHASAQAMVAYAMGLPAFVLIKILATGFYARGDTKTPVVIACYCLLINLAGNLSFIFLFPEIGLMAHTGLAFATSLSAWVNAASLFILLKKRDYFTVDAILKRRFWRMMAAVAVTTLALWGAHYGLAPWLEKPIYGKITGLLLMIVSGAASYFLMTQLLRIYSFRELLRRFKRSA